MGSLILSRSFHVEQYEEQNQDEGGSDSFYNRDAGMEMDVGDAARNLFHDDVDGDALRLRDSEGMDVTSDVEESEESEDGDNPEDVAMVPLADILNARYGSANVSDFKDPLLNSMRSRI
jgi:N-lysine methyltransferase SETD6